MFDTMVRPARKNRLLRYLFSLVAVAVAFFLSWLLWPVVNEGPFVFFYGAVALSAWFGGLIPGLLATVLSMIVVDYFLVEPLYVIFNSVGDVVRLGIFAGSAVLVSWLNEARQISEDELRRSRDQLQIIFEGVEDGISAQDQSGQLVFANEAAAKLVGFPSVSALLQTPTETIESIFEVFDLDGTAVPVLELPSRQALRSGKTVERTVRLFRRDLNLSRWLTIKSAPVVNEKNQVIYSVNILRDMTDTIQQERLLRDQRERFEVTLNSIDDAVLTIGMDGKVDFMNPVAQSLTGWTEADAVGQPYDAVLRLVNDDTNEAVAFSLETLMNNGYIVDRANHASLLDRNDAKKPVDARGTPIRDQDGKAIGVVFVFRDISDLRETQRIREESAQRLRDVIDGLAAFVGMMTPDGILIEANRRALEAAQLQPEDVLGKPFEETFWWSYDPQVQVELRSAINRAATGESVRYDVQVRVANDQFIIIDFVLSPIFDQDDRVTHIVPSGIDITQRKRAEVEMTSLTNMIEHQRQRLRNIVANVPGVVWEAWGDPDSATQNIDFVSDYVELMLGYRVDDWLSTPNFWLSIVHPDDRERAAAESKTIYDGGKTGVSQFRWVTKDGRDIPVEAHSTVICDDNGRPVGMRGMTMDIRERMRNQEELENYARELARSNAELEQFAYVASHDLQEPLRMVSSYLQLIEQRYSEQLDENAHVFINYAVDGASRMKNLINDLLAYSRVGTRGKPFARTSCQTVLDQVLHNLQATIRETEAVITHDPMPEIIADEAQLLQLFQNLIGNALKFRGERAPEVHVSADRRGREWYFAVRDNGIGIDPAYSERIFLVFQRLYAPDEYEGTGIGLAICKKVVERHGGRIWVESTPGQGTTFHFTIPLKPKQRKEEVIHELN
ncbi:MAG: hypothetical protein CL610_03520 [Anaerolineaceae bacterium]|nr:hypothetical protein [Anaerolineaceae bacterium]